MFRGLGVEEWSLAARLGGGGYASLEGRHRGGLQTPRDGSTRQDGTGEPMPVHLGWFGGGRDPRS